MHLKKRPEKKPLTWTRLGERLDLVSFVCSNFFPNTRAAQPAKQYSTVGSHINACVPHQTNARKSKTAETKRALVNVKLRPQLSQRGLSSGKQGSLGRMDCVCSAHTSLKLLSWTSLLATSSASL